MRAAPLIVLIVLGLPRRRQALGSSRACKPDASDPDYLTCYRP